jgi:hypothetical protein
LADTSPNYNIRTWQANAMDRAKHMGQGTHPLFLGDCYLWNRILIRPMSYSVQFAASENVKVITSANQFTATETDQAVNAGLGAGFRVSRATLLGAQAFAVIQGNNSKSGMTAAYSERVFDHGSKYESVGEWMGAETKLRFQFKDYAGNLVPTDHGVYVFDFAIRNT